MRLCPTVRKTKGALKISGNIKPGFAFPWAGVFFAPGENSMQPLNYANAKELVFWAKGDGRRYNVMTFSSTSAGVPPSQSFVADSEWKEIRLPLAGFEGLELSSVTGFSFNARREGSSVQIDNVEKRVY